jgi:hypothetical protein
MSNGWTAVAWLAALLLPLLLLKRWLSRHLQGFGLLLTKDQQTAILLQYLVLFPGIVLHELSHLLAAALVGVRTKGFSLHPTATRGGNVRLGAVIVRQSDPIRESWIGLAPLLSGCAVILLLARWKFGLQQLSAIRPEALVQSLYSYLRAPDAWLWLYLIFAVSNAMLPSESDRQPWGPLLIFLALTAAVVYATRLVPRVPVAVKEWTLTAVRYLHYAFGLTIGVDALFAALLFVVEKLAERILRRRVEY